MNKVLTSGLEDYLEVGKNELNIEKIINDFSSSLYRFVKNNNYYGNNSYYLNKEDIEEIVSESFFVLWNNYKKLDLSDNISNYLCGVSRNILLKKLRKNKIFNKNVNIEDYQNILDSKKDVEDMFYEQERISFMENIVLGLDSESREIFILYYYEQRKVKEISKILNISESKVKTKLYRIRKKLKKELKEGGYGYGK